jgi:DNA-binding FrmR family transcriptional regulator
MGHTQKHKEKLLLRVRRLRGQLDSVENALLEGRDCSVVLHRLSACRGAMNGLLVEVLEDHVREHIVDPARQPASPRAAAAEELLDVIRSYFK